MKLRQHLLYLPEIGKEAQQKIKSPVQGILISSRAVDQISVLFKRFCAKLHMKAKYPAVRNCCRMCIIMTALPLLITASGLISKEKGLEQLLCVLRSP